MNPIRIRPHRKHRLLFATLASLALSGACSDDEASVVPPAELTLEIVELDGSTPDADATLRCDGLAVEVAITPALGFTLRPLHACGSSTRCGYVYFEALDAEDNVLGSAYSVTTLGLLELPSRALPELAAVRAVLLRGIDGEPVTNADGSEVTARVDVNRPAPSCEQGLGGQGQGGGASSAGAPASEGGSSPGGSGSGAGRGIETPTR